MNRLLFGQININSIRKKFELLFSLVSNNIDVLLISETKIKNKFPVSQFCVHGYSVPFRLDRTWNEGGIMLCFYLVICYYVIWYYVTLCRVLRKFIFENEIEAFLLKLICVRLSVS